MPMASPHALHRLYRALISAGVIQNTNPRTVRREYTYPANIDVVTIEDVVTMNKAMDKALGLARGCTRSNPCVVGLDTEWANRNDVVLLQLSVHKTCLLIRMRMVQESDKNSSETATFSKIQELFSLPNAIFVGSGIYECDLEKLLSQFSMDIGDIKWIDTQDAAKCLVSSGVFKQCKRPGLAGLTKKLFDVPLNKGEQCSKWDAEDLSGSQIKYAVCDAVVSREIVEQMYMRAVLCNKTDVGFGDWLWDLRDRAKSIHAKHHHHHHGVETQHPRGYKKAIRLFETMDANSSGVLEDKELLELAEWYWTRTHPGDTKAPPGTYEEMVEMIHAKYGADFHLQNQIDLYSEYAPKMYKANKVYQDSIKVDV